MDPPAAAQQQEKEQGQQESEPAGRAGEEGAEDEEPDGGSGTGGPWLICTSTAPRGAAPMAMAAPHEPQTGHIRGSRDPGTPLVGHRGFPEGAYQQSPTLSPLPDGENGEEQPDWRA